MQGAHSLTKLTAIVWPVLPWLRVIWLVDLNCERHERHEREFCTRSFKITELEKGRWSWISNCGEAFHTDSWLAEANPGHTDRDAILQALLPGPSTVVLFGPGKARMPWIQLYTSRDVDVIFNVLTEPRLNLRIAIGSLNTDQVQAGCKTSLLQATHSLLSSWRISI